MAVFGLHAMLPAISTYSALAVILGSVWPANRPDPNGWDLLHQLSAALLGLYSLCAAVSRHLRSEWPEAEESPGWAGPAARGLSRTLRISRTAARAGCVLAAWTYISLLLDLGVTLLVAIRHRNSAHAVLEADQTWLGVVPRAAWLLGARPGSNPMQSDKAVAFGLSLVSVLAQHRLVELLGRREVLLRLIGAERVTASTLCLLLKGVAVACSNAKCGSNPVAEFLARVAPPPAYCVLIAAVRGQAVVLGAALVLAPRLTSTLGTTTSFALGLVAGVHGARAVLRVWYDSGGELVDSPALRLALLVPGGVSARAKGVLRGALSGARTRAVQMMAMGAIDRAIRWWCWKA